MFRQKKSIAYTIELRNAESLAHLADDGHMTESLVYHYLKNRFEEHVFYWREDNEIDFIIKEGNTITQIRQVVAGKAR